MASLTVEQILDLLFRSPSECGTYVISPAGHGRSATKPTLWISRTCYDNPDPDSGQLRKRVDAGACEGFASRRSISMHVMANPTTALSKQFTRL